MIHRYVLSAHVFDGESLADSRLWEAIVTWHVVMRQKAGKWNAGSCHELNQEYWLEQPVLYYWSMTTGQLPAFICTAGVVLNTSITHLAATLYVLMVLEINCWAWFLYLWSFVQTKHTNEPCLRLLAAISSLLLLSLVLTQSDPMYIKQSYGYLGC